ncbi:hypothetical protein ZEAMMB73_Zm00001d010327 [Zea mays]|uniref:Uncharacterized protein n=1 Tax=Zea mays TaxID=4577 RepID=A0A1D6FQJ0_MAIZE|nr:hypothetical protein ZEAMMB73_Zm00001d010327 [Zea mays]
MLSPFAASQHLNTPAYVVCGIRGHKQEDPIKELPGRPRKEEGAKEIGRIGNNIAVLIHPLDDAKDPRAQARGSDQCEGQGKRDVREGQGVVGVDSLHDDLRLGGKDKAGQRAILQTNWGY